MKTLDRKIEEDITQVGQNNSYPTQIVINLDDLKPVDETHWQVGDTDIILTGQKHFLTTTIDGIQYCTLTKYDDEESKLNDTYPQLGNHIGLCVNKIAKETIEEGITLGSGHLLSTAHGNNTCRIVSRRWEYNEFGEEVREKEDEKVLFSMVADSLIQNEGWQDSWKPWHVALAITDTSILISGESIRGRFMTHFDVESYNLSDVVDVNYINGKIVIRLMKETLTIEGKQLENVFEALKECIQK